MSQLTSRWLVSTEWQKSLPLRLSRLILMIFVVLFSTGSIDFLNPVNMLHIPFCLCTFPCNILYYVPIREIKVFSCKKSQIFIIRKFYWTLKLTQIEKGLVDLFLMHPCQFLIPCIDYWIKLDIRSLHYK